jgi:hypothetical protein
MSSDLLVVACWHHVGVGVDLLAGLILALLQSRLLSLRASDVRVLLIALVLRKGADCAGASHVHFFVCGLQPSFLQPRRERLQQRRHCSHSLPWR